MNRTKQSYDVNWKKVLHIATKHEPFWIEGKERKRYGDKIISFDTRCLISVTLSTI